jgi:hypothetical protein
MVNAILAAQTCHSRIPNASMLYSGLAGAPYSHGAFDINAGARPAAGSDLLAGISPAERWAGVAGKDISCPVTLGNRASVGNLFSEAELKRP